MIFFFFLPGYPFSFTLFMVLPFSDHVILTLPRKTVLLVQPYFSLLKIAPSEEAEGHLSFHVFLLSLSRWQAFQRWNIFTSK